VTEKIHPSALPITKGHALEALALDLHRHAQNRQWTVLDFFEFPGVVLHISQHTPESGTALTLLQYIAVLNKRRHAMGGAIG
jgi:hypothetical protein